MTLVTEENRRWWALGALGFSLFMIMLDNTIVSVALPTIQSELKTSLTQLEWVVNAYTLVFAVTLLSGGKLADFLGRRRIFILGLVIFTASSLACGLATSGGLLIGARAVQGIGAALMLPATLSIITATFPVKERGLAIGVWAGISGVALAIGPLIGGLLAQHAGWEWIFYVNIPVGVIAIFATLWVVRESRDTTAEQRLDIPGLVTSGIGIFALNFGLIEGDNYGWSSGTIVLSFVAAAVFLVIFVVLELRQRLPMLDIGLFRNRTFAGANAGGTLMFIALFTYIFFFSIYLQSVLGYSAVQAGATFLVSTSSIMVVAPLSGNLSDKIGARLPVTVGMALFGVAMIPLSRLDASSSFWDMAPWLLIGGAGFGAIMPPLTAAVLSSVDPDKAGVASGVMQVFRQFGGGLGVAIMGAIVASNVGELTPRDLGYAGKFVSGFQTILLLAAIISFVSAVVAFLTIRTHVAVGEGELSTATGGGGAP